MYILMALFWMYVFENCKNISSENNNSRGIMIVINVIIIYNFSRGTISSINFTIVFRISCIHTGKCIRIF